MRNEFRKPPIFFGKISALRLNLPFFLTQNAPYDAEELSAYIDGKDAMAVIRPKSKPKNPACMGQDKYRNRAVVERFFTNPKQLWLVVTRYNKLASRFASFVALATSVMWPKQSSKHPSSSFDNNQIGKVI